MARYTPDGRAEIPDPVPVALPVGFRPPEPLADLIKRLVRTEMSAQAAKEGNETFEEADDFEVEDEEEAPLSAYQLDLMKEDRPLGVLPDASAASLQARGGAEKASDVPGSVVAVKDAPKPD